jgi:hypothetical protein
MSTNTRLPAATTAIASYLSATKRDDDKKANGDEPVKASEIRRQLPKSVRKTIDTAAPDFFDDTENFNDAGIKSALYSVGVSPDVINAVRKIRSNMAANQKTTAAGIRKKGLLAKRTQEALTQRSIASLRSPFDNPANTFAATIRQAMQSRKPEAQLVDIKHTPATISPRKRTRRA